MPKLLLFQQRVARSARYTLEVGGKSAVLALDIARFERIDDTYGPRIGDECTKRIASILSHTLGQQVVAEGVETQEELLSLWALQGDLLQGYLLSRPVLPAEVSTLLAPRHAVFSRSPNCTSMHEAQTERQGTTTNQWQHS